MLRRKSYDELLQWKNSSEKKALCIIGARQIGKTTLIRKFATENYKVFAEINFITEPNATKIFENSLDANTIITNLSAFIHQELKPHETLILFDEIQECPNARSAIKFLVEDGRFDYIESGSLLGVNYKEVKSFPVGFEEIYQMFPMDFEEFLWANGVQNSTIEYLKNCFETKTSVTQVIHETMNKLFYSYIVIGGMPAVVQQYVDSHDIGKVVRFQNDILELYRLDISKYASSSDKIKIKDIFDSIPSQLNDKNRRFYLNSIDKNARLNRYDNSFKWLSDAGVALPCYNVNSPEVPLVLNEKHSLFKLFMGDTGLLCAACMDNIQFDILNGNLQINMGSILENIVAQQLKSGGFNLYYFDSIKYGEIDFVIQNGTKLDLIEVKSGKDYKKHKALDNLLNIKEWKFNNSYVLCRDNISVEKFSGENSIMYLPWYMFMFLHTKLIPEGSFFNVDVSALN